MKKFITLLLLTVIITGISLNCERDDICPENTPNTPRLYISFIDNTDFEEVKSVTSFRVEDANDSTNVLDDYDQVTTSEVLLPLKTTVNETSFILYKDYALDANNLQTGNADTITITYSRESIFVSRACGYKTIFKNVVITIEDDTDNWILNNQTINDNLNIEDETEVHSNFAH